MLTNKFTTNGWGKVRCIFPFLDFQTSNVICKKWSEFCKVKAAQLVFIIRIILSPQCPSKTSFLSCNELYYCNNSLQNTSPSHTSTTQSLYSACKIFINADERNSVRHQSDYLLLSKLPVVSEHYQFRTICQLARLCTYLGADGCERGCVCVCVDSFDVMSLLASQYGHTEHNLHPFTSCLLTRDFIFSGSTFGQICAKVWLLSTKSVFTQILLV